jgi:integrase
MQLARAAHLLPMDARSALAPGDVREQIRDAFPGATVALVRAGLTRLDAKKGDPDYTRPFHDGRHTSLTNSAAAGMQGMAIMARAGHSDFGTTQLYIDLAGEQFPDEAELLEQRLWGAGTKTRYQTADPSPDQATATAATQG